MTNLENPNSEINKALEQTRQEFNKSLTDIMSYGGIPYSIKQYIEALTGKFNPALETEKISKYRNIYLNEKWFIKHKKEDKQELNEVTWLKLANQNNNIKKSS